MNLFMIFLKLKSNRHRAYSTCTAESRTHIDVTAHEQWIRS
jgi:hypothetical protein